LKDILFLTPPFTQLNTPYPATAYLSGFFKTKSIETFQMDLGIDVILELFSAKTFETIFDIALNNDCISSENCERIYALKHLYLLRIDEVILFLQGQNPSLARQICSGQFLPQASRFDELDDLDWAFGNMGMQDKAKHLATLFLEDLSDFIKECIDENFGFSRYAERLGQSANSFDKLEKALQEPLSFIDEITIRIFEKQLKIHNPKLVCISIPFPGNLFSGFRIGQFLKQNYPEITVSIGGGFPNTELRTIKDPRVFNYIDFITLDDGERPLEILLDYVKDKNSLSLSEYPFKRTFYCENNQVIYSNSSALNDYKQKDLGTPSYVGLPLNKYISVIELANPMHSLWSDGRWNKLTMAHGCYWGKCTFCDVSLDYIKTYEPVAAKILVDRMEELIQTTGEYGFHFVDEAAPPALMRSVALEILKRNLTVTWWTNIRFEKSFTQDLCILLKASGCIAVSGGLEVASDRLLELIDKGVTVEQVAKVTRNLTESGIMVHSYLMYGYPTQTEQETIDSLEMVRQLFELEILQSGFWHQFALTAHSPIGFEPEKYKIQPILNDITFANNDVQFIDETGIDHSKFSFGLKKSLFNFMHGVGFDLKLQDWFDFKIPKSTISKTYIQDQLNAIEYTQTKPNAKLVWLGQMPIVTEFTKKKKGKELVFLNFTFHTLEGIYETNFEKEVGLFVLDFIQDITPQNKPKTYNQLKKEYESQLEDFALFWHSKPLQTLKENELLIL